MAIDPWLEIVRDAQMQDAGFGMAVLQTKSRVHVEPGVYKVPMLC